MSKLEVPALGYDEWNGWPGCNGPLCTGDAVTVISGGTGLTLSELRTTAPEIVPVMHEGISRR